MGSSFIFLSTLTDFEFPTLYFTLLFCIFAFSINYSATSSYFINYIVISYYFCLSLMFFLKLLIVCYSIINYLLLPLLNPLSSILLFILLSKYIMFNCWILTLLFVLSFFMHLCSFETANLWFDYYIYHYSINSYNYFIKASERAMCYTNL